MAASFSFMRNHVSTWTIMFVHGCSASFVGGCPCMGVVVFICGHLSSYVHGCFCTCVVVSVHVWLSPYVHGCFRTCVAVFEWTQVSEVVGMGVLVCCCCWWAMGGRCQLCDRRRGTGLTYDGDDACCHHHLDNMAWPHCLPARLAVAAGDMALPRCCHPMVHVVLVVGG